MTNENRIKLTPCELECLRWFAAGKTRKEIAIITGWSIAAVNDRSKELRRKFDTVKIASAVYKAAKLDII